jgi:hypothetical protein
MTKLSETTEDRQGEAAKRRGSEWDCSSPFPYEGMISESEEENGIERVSGSIRRLKLLNLAVKYSVNHRKIHEEVAQAQNLLSLSSSLF